ncbi:MAG: DUF4390 domain-containing protein [Nitrospiraceae bacterium]|jgi:hypothetical protein|nr:DUF4390 domain-containing protein [Nitrospiraceae bacterium]
MFFFRILTFFITRSPVARRAALFGALFLATAAVGPELAFATDIKNVDIAIRNHDLFVTTGVLYDDDFLNDMKQGLSKELVFAFELYSIRQFFPDEYILGKKITVSLKNDPIKREFVARIMDGTATTEKRFKDTESMTAWALLSRTVKVVNLKELDPATYYVKVSVESRIRKLPPVIKILLFFIPETEFSVWRYSQTFTLPLETR